MHGFVSRTRAWYGTHAPSLSAATCQDVDIEDLPRFDIEFYEEYEQVGLTVW